MVWISVMLSVNMNEAYHNAPPSLQANAMIQTDHNCPLLCVVNIHVHLAHVTESY